MNKTVASVVFLLVLSAGLRLYGITNPLADWHSWRQANTAAVARNFVTFGIQPLYPRAHDLSNIQTGKDNPQGYFMVEFPLYQTIAAVLGKIVPGVPIEVVLRIVTITASTGTVLLLLSLAGFLPALVFAVLPYSVYYGRTVLPEPFMVFWAVLSLWFVKKKRIIPGAIAAAIALLAKPTAIFLLLPAFYMLYKQYKKLFMYWIIAGIPLVLWRKWILNFPEGIPVSTWLLNGNGIRFKGAWFHWLFAKRLGELILGYWGLVPFALGMSAWWGVGALLYLVIFATGNVQHDYYQILIIPAVSVFVGHGLRKLKPWLAIVCFAFMLAFSWYTVRTYYWINRPEIVEAGKIADALLPRDAKVIAPYNGDTTFLYQTGRQGWPIGFEIDNKIAMGATHYVTVSPTDDDLETKALAEKYTVLVRNDKFAIIDLTKLASPARGLQ